jgi:iron complex outermembrane recepter protein
MVRVKREIGKVRCCPRNGKQVWVYPQATGPSAWEGDTSKLASPDTGPKRLAKVPRGVGAGPFFSLQFVLLHPPQRFHVVNATAGSLVAWSMYETTFVFGGRRAAVCFFPVLSSIPLESIERIEITKGSGATRFGDGAMAGTIQIYTKNQPSNSLSVAAGNYGARSSNLSVGVQGDKVGFSFVGQHLTNGGFSAPDSTGNRDRSSSNSGDIKLNFSPSDAVFFDFVVGASDIDVRYPGALSLSQFNQNPAQTPVQTNYKHTHQKLKTDWWSLDTDFQINKDLNLRLKHSQNDRSSSNLTWEIYDKYKYEDSSFEAVYEHGSGELIVGVNKFDGKRVGSDNVTSKNNLGYYLLGNIKNGKSIFSAGIRREKVDYRYSPNSGSDLSRSNNLTGWDIGINHRLNTEISIFSNLTSGFQAPDIDRFFLWGGAFNGFINPAKIKTLNIGLNHQGSDSKTKITSFYSRLKDEIYLCKSNAVPTCGGFGDNRNIDKSSKYGFDIQHSQALGKGLSGSVNYAWTKAVVKTAANGQIQNKELPGVSRHNLTLALDYQLNAQHRLGVTHTWRSKAYSLEDFQNSLTQRQKPFESTSVKYTYSQSQNVDLFVKVDNVFEKQNGLWLRNDVIYPVNFTRNWMLGLNAKF